MAGVAQSQQPACESCTREFTVADRQVSYLDLNPILDQY